MGQHAVLVSSETCKMAATDIRTVVFDNQSDEYLNLVGSMHINFGHNSSCNTKTLRCIGPRSKLKWQFCGEDVEASIWFTMIGLGIPVPDSYNISRTKGYKWDLELALNTDQSLTKSLSFHYTVDDDDKSSKVQQEVDGSESLSFSELPSIEPNSQITVSIKSKVPPSLRILSSYSVFFMYDVQDLACDVPMSLFESLLEMKDNYEVYERNIEVQKQVLHEDHEE